MTEEEDVADKGEEVEISHKFTVRFKRVNYDSADRISEVRETYMHEAGADFDWAAGGVIGDALCRLHGHDLDGLETALSGITDVVESHIHSIRRLMARKKKEMEGGE
jgi:hypothetical protein